MNQQTYCCYALSHNKSALMTKSLVAALAIGCSVSAQVLQFVSFDDVSLTAFNTTVNRPSDGVAFYDRCRMSRQYSCRYWQSFRGRAHQRNYFQR